MSTSSLRKRATYLEVSHASMEQMWGSESRHMSQAEAPKVNLTAYVRLGESLAATWPQHSMVSSEYRRFSAAARVLGNSS